MIVSEKLVYQLSPTEKRIQQLEFAKARLKAARNDYANARKALSNASKQWSKIRKMKQDLYNKGYEVSTVYWLTKLIHSTLGQRLKQVTSSRARLINHIHQVEDLLNRKHRSFRKTKKV